MANRRTGWPAGMAMLANVSHLLIAVNSAINIIVYAIKVLLQEQFKLKEMTMAMIVLHGNYKLISYFLFFLECFYSTAWNRYYSFFFFLSSSSLQLFTGPEVPPSPSTSVLAEQLTNPHNAVQGAHSIIITS